MENELRKILKNHQLRVTECRLAVMEYFIQSGNALSQGDLENHFTEFDRVTLYRTLHSFLESGILHQIPNESGAATYGLCHDTCTPDHHQHDHVHFKCNQCGQIECLDKQPVPQVKVPEHYLTERINVIVDGVCAKCSTL